MSPAFRSRLWTSQSIRAPKAHLPSRTIATILMIAMRPMTTSDRFHTKSSEATAPIPAATTIMARRAYTMIVSVRASRLRPSPSRKSTLTWA